MSDSEFMRVYRGRVEEMLGPIRRLYGEGSPVERTALVLLAEAEEVEDFLQKRRVGTSEAADRTGWSYDTLQGRAKEVLAGKEVPDRWAGLIVERSAGAYQFVLESIPPKTNDPHV